MAPHLFAKPLLWLLLLIITGFCGYFYNIPYMYSIPIGIVSMYNVLLESFVSLSFLTPGRPKPSFEAKGWQNHEFNFESRVVNTIAHWKETPAPLLVLVHGWRASSASVSDRGRWFAERGWHVLMIELPSHGSSETTPVWSAYKSMQAVECVCRNLEQIVESNMIESSMYYGHSMGGFVGLRLLNQPDLSIGGQPFSGLILESPMTMYSPILEEISTALRIPSPIKGTYRRRLIQRFNASITPRTKFHSMEEFDLPLWGGPSIPVLCIQADPDQRLGMEHYDRLLSTYKQRGQSELLTAHRVKGLTHTGAKIHPARNQLIAEWLRKRG